MRYCIICEEQVADGVRGATRLSATLTHWFGRESTRTVIPVAESAMPDEEEHMAFAHGFTLLAKHMVDGKVVAQGPWVCVSEADGFAFGETWERVDARSGRKV